MYFKIGYTVRPKNVNISNQVIFEEYDAEDVLQDVLPTESECIAYGFVFRDSDSKCVVVETPLRFNYPKPTDNLSINRASNFIGRNTRDNIIAGSSHIIYSNNYGNIISGENNSITDLVSNTTISGTKGEATADNSNVIGGNSVLAGTSPLGNELIQNGDFSDLGAEKVTNGDFATNSNWVGVGSNGWSIDTALQQLDAVSASSYAYQGIGTVSGKTYKVVVDATLTSGGCIVRGFSANNIISINISGRNTYTAYFTETDSNPNIGFLTDGEEFTGSIHSISVKEVGVSWIIGSGWTISNNSASHVGGAGYLRQNSIQANTLYKVNLSVTAVSGGGFVQIYMGNSPASVLISTVGNYTYSFTSQSTVTLGFALRSLGNVTIDNVSVVEVLPYIAPKQSIQLLYGLQSTDGSNQSSFLNGITDSLFAIPENSVMYFHADIVAVRVGGTDTSGGGLVGDFASWVERGVIINKSRVLSISRERDTIKSSGHVTNWQPTAIVDGISFGMRVRGHADTTIEWASNITFTEIKTGVAL